MMYERYENRIKKVAKIKNQMYRFRILIISTFSVIMATIIVLLSIKGNITSLPSIPQELIYGEEIAPTSTALFTGVSYEYRQANGDWSSEVPKRAGEYEVRSVADATIGTKHSEPVKFTILPKNIDLKIKSNRVNYGEYPIFNTDVLIKGDRIKEYTFTYDDLKANKTLANLNIASIVIVDENDIDVTASYNISFYNNEAQEISFIPLNINLTPDGANKIYDGKELTIPNTYTLKGTLGFDDKISVSEYKIYDENHNEVNPVKPGNYSLEIASYDILNGEESRLNNYNVQLKTLPLVIEKRELFIETKSEEFIYDGLDKQAIEYELKDSTLAEGDSFEILNNSTIKYVGEKENRIDLTIKNEKENVLDCYIVKYSYGTLKVLKRDLTIRTKSEEFTYDNEYHNSKNYDIVSGDLPLTDSIEIINDTSKLAVGSYENILDLKFYNGNIESTLSFNVTFEYGTLTINKANVKLEGLNYNIIYGDSYLTETYEYNLEEGTLYDNPDIKLYLSYYQNELEQTPKNVGEYDIHYTYESECYNVTILNDKKLTIEAFEFDLSLIEADEFIYDGLSHLYLDEPNNYISDNVVLPYDDVIKINVSYDEIPLNAGTYNIYYNDFEIVSLNDSVVNNYKINVLNPNIQYIINPFEMVIKPINYETKEYDGISYEAYSDLFGNFESDVNLFEDDQIKIITEIKNLNDEVIKNPKDASVYRIEIVSCEALNTLLDNYSFVYESESFEITRRTITLKPINYETKEYDGIAYSAYEIKENNFVDVENKLLEEEPFTIKVDVTKDDLLITEIKNAGLYNIKIYEYETLNSLNYDVRLEDSEFEITRRTITLKPFNYETKEYDGIAYSAYEIKENNFIDVENKLLEEEPFTIKVDVIKDNLLVNEIKNAGKYKLIINDIITLESSNYDISYETQEFEILKRKLVVSPISFEQEYDSKSYSYEDVMQEAYLLLDNTSLVDGEEVEFDWVFNIKNTESDKIKDAGQYNIKYSSSHAKTQSFNFDNYDILYNDAKAIINPHKLIYTFEELESYEKVYDGKELYVKAITTDALYEDDEVEIQIAYEYSADGKISNPKCILNAGAYVASIEKINISKGNKNNYEILYDKADTLEYVVNRKVIYFVIENQGETLDTTYDGLSHDIRVDYENTTEFVQNEFLIAYVNDNEFKDSYKDVGHYEFRITKVEGFESTLKSNYICEISNCVTYVNVNRAPLTIELKLNVTNEVYDSINDLYYRNYDYYKYLSIDSFSVNFIGLCGNEKLNYSLLLDGNEFEPQNDIGRYIITIGSIEFQNEDYSLDNYEYNLNQKITYSIITTEVTINLLDYNSFDAKETKMYDGIEIVYPENNNYSILGLNDSILTDLKDNNFRLYVNIFDQYNNPSKILNVGKYKISIDIKKTNEEMNEKLFENYSFNYGDDLEIVIEKRPIELEIELNYFNDTKNFTENSFEYDDIVRTYQITNGNYLSVGTNDVIESDLISIEVLNYKYTYNSTDSIVTSLKEVGEYVGNEYDIHFESMITRNNYIISISSPTFTITQKVVEISPKEINDKDYDGLYHDYNNLNNNYNNFSSTYDLYGYEEAIRIYVNYEDSNNNILTKVIDADKYYVSIYEIVYKPELESYMKKNFVINYLTISFRIKPLMIQIRPLLNEGKSIYNKEEIIYDNYCQDNINYEYVSENKLVGSDSLTLNYKIYNSLNEESIIKNADKYEIRMTGVTFTSGKQSNYFVMGSVSKYEVLPIEVSFEVLDIESFTYDGSIKYYATGFGNYKNVTYNNSNLEFEFEIELFNMSFKNAATYSLGIKSIKAVKNDLVSNFKLIELEAKSLKINQKDITISLIDLDSNGHIYYDGNKHDYPDSFENYILEEGTLALNDSIKIVPRYIYDGKEVFNIIEAGIYTISSKEYVLKQNGIVVNDDNYKINVLNDYYEFVLYKAKVSIALSSISNYVYNGITINSVNNETLNGSKKSKINYTQDKNFEDLKITPVVTIKYNGNIVDKIHDVGLYELQITKIDGYDSNNKTYDVVYSNSIISFEISKASLKIKPDNKNFTGLNINNIYDGTEAKYINKANNFKLVEGELPSGDDIRIILKSYISEEEQALKYAGTYKLVIDDVIYGNKTNKDNYTLIFVDEEFIISKRKVQLIPKVDDKIYDGLYYDLAKYNKFGNYNSTTNNPYYSVLEDDFSKIKLSLYFDEEIINVGKYELKVSNYIIEDGYSEYFNMNYEISTEKTNVYIHVRDIKINLLSEERITYDGLEHHYNALYDYFDNYTYGADSLEFVDNASQSGKTKVKIKTIYMNDSKVFSNVYFVGDYSILLDNNNTIIENDLISNYKITILNDYFSIDKLDVTITFPDFEAEYDGYLHSIDHFESSVPIPTTDEVFYEADEFLLPIEGEKYTVTNTRINNSLFGEDVTNCYNYEVVNGAATIAKRKIKISTGSLEEAYTGFSHVCTDYTIIDGSLTDLDQIMSVLPNSSDKNVGTYDNKLKFKIYNRYDAKLVEMDKYYDITYDYGTISITKAVINILGYQNLDYAYTKNMISFNKDNLILDNELYIKDDIDLVFVDSSNNSNFIDIGSYNVRIGSISLSANSKSSADSYEFNYDGSLEATLNINKRLTNITLEGKSFAYTGDEITYTNYYADNLLNGDYLALKEETVTSYINVGDYELNYEVDIYDEEGLIVTDKYEINYIKGTLSIAGSLTISASSTKVGGEVTFNVTFNQSASNLSLVGLSVIGDIKSIGQRTVYVNFADIVDEEGNSYINYQITNPYTDQGYEVLVNIERIDITLLIKSFSKKYDGQALNYEDQTGTLVKEIKTGSSYNLLKGHRITVDQSNLSITEPGSILIDESRITILDENYNDVTNNYNITFVDGYLAVTQISITISPKSSVKTYDGSELRCEKYNEDQVQSKLLHGHRIEVVGSSSITDVGYVLNELQIVVKDQYNNDVTNYYNIVQTEAYLIVVA